MPFRPNWHADAIAEHLEAVTLGQIRNLVINIPPGHAKSIIVGVLWPAWVWIDWPEWRGLFSSYDLSLVTRDAVRCRDVMESEWYQTQFAPRWKFKGDQNVKTFYKNTRQGFRFAHTVAGKGTGHRGDAIVCDDPLNAKDRHSTKKREACIDWWDRTMPTRLNDPARGVKVVIMQRLHEEDLTGHILQRGGYEHLCLPSEFEPERRSRTFILDPALGEKKRFWEDPRTERGELLFPSLFTGEVLADLKTVLKEDGYAGQHQQRPTPAEGGMFKRWYWRYWCHEGQQLPPVRVQLPGGDWQEIPAVPLPKSFPRVAQSWDMSFKDTQGSDYVVGQVWGAKGADRFLLDQVRDRLAFSATVEALKRLSKAWPQARAKFVEDKANGPAVISHLKSEIPGLIAVNPGGDNKEARAWAVEPEVKAGNVYLPHPQLAPWVDAFVSEWASFPHGANDDQVDTGSQLLNQFANSVGGGVYSQ